jgi:hypothetical protein
MIAKEKDLANRSQGEKISILLVHIYIGKIVRG